jgi:acyl dehydratase
VPLDPSFVGHVYPPTETYLVSRERVREFADAIGADNPAHRDVAAARAHGYPDVVAPPTFPVVVTNAVITMLRDDPALGLDFTRLVHGDQRFAYARPVVAGDELACVCTVEEIMSRGGHEFLTTRTDVLDPAGSLVVSVWSMFVVRGES